MTTDPRWSACLFQLCALWNRLGPDRTLAALKVAAISDVTAEGLLVLDIAATGKAGQRARPTFWRGWALLSGPRNLWWAMTCVMHFWRALRQCRKLSRR